MNDQKPTFRAVYRDTSGSEPIEIRTVGSVLRTTIREVEFEGTDFDSFEAVEGSELAVARGFALNHGALCSCELEIEIGVRITVGDVSESSLMHAVLVLGGPAVSGGIESETLQLSVSLREHVWRSKGASGWFEDELLDLQRQLPEGAYLQMCFNCAFSDYHPAGHGLFGGLACFRENKAGYRSVTSKSELFAVWDTKTELVQETHLCPEFERRRSGTGYRG